jgi:two-component system, OmpR family, sensor histidine kinase VicK
LTIESTSPDAISERTEVLHGEQNVVKAVLQFICRAKNRIDACVDSTRPSLALGIEELREAFVGAKRRGVKLRYVSEITEDNVVYCKDLLKIVNELHHIEGIKGNFYISEREYIAPATFHKKGKPASHVIYSNVKEIVEYQRQFVFDSFWSRSIPAEQKIKEIEEGITHYETKVLENKQQIFNHMKAVLGKANERSVVSSVGGMQLVYNNFFEQYKAIVDKQRRRGGLEVKGKGKSKGIRWITSIDKDSVQLVKVFLNAGIQVRHIKNLTSMNFAVDDRYFYATISKMENGELMENLLISNEPAYIGHYNSIFEGLWKNGVDATQRIKDIEVGVDLADIEVIPSSARARAVYLNIVNAASEEILWIFPTTNAFLRQDRMDAVPLAIQAARERNVKVKILVPTNRSIEERLQQLREHYALETVDVRRISQMSETKATILVVDRKDSMVMELKDDSKSTFYEAVGLSTYSNSKAGVLSYVSIFENLWKQSELYEELMKTHEQLREAHEQLKKHDKMQKEFIDIAAHELRTPIQPILGLSEIVLSNTKDTEQAKLLEVVNRNAKRLQQLTEDILDVTKIESQSLNLKKEQFNLNVVITNAIEDIMTKKVSPKTEIKNNNAAIKLQYHQPQDVFLYGDKGRISQVIHNLLYNAVKFTNDNDGAITVITEKKDIEDHEQPNSIGQRVIVSIKDNGKGIDPQIFPRLFTRFATKSQTGGTGLGLFICKGIVEAHGGKIWAENNQNESGASFSFSLPIVIAKNSIY